VALRTGTCRSPGSVAFSQGGSENRTTNQPYLQFFLWCIYRNIMDIMGTITNNTILGGVEWGLNMIK
jgi:hypothetical protein